MFFSPPEKPQMSAGGWCPRTAGYPRTIGIKLDLCFCTIPTVGLYGKLGEITATHYFYRNISCRRTPSCSIVANQCGVRVRRECDYLVFVRARRSGSEARRTGWSRRGGGMPPPPFARPPPKFHGGGGGAGGGGGFRPNADPELRQQEMMGAPQPKKRVTGIPRTFLTLGAGNPPPTAPEGRSYRILSLLIHISPNNCAINMIQVGKLFVNVLAIHCAFQTMSMSIRPLLMKLLYLYVMRW